MGHDNMPWIWPQELLRTFKVSLRIRRFTMGCYCVYTHSLNVETGSVARAPAHYYPLPGRVHFPGCKYIRNTKEAECMNICRVSRSRTSSILRVARRSCGNRRILLVAYIIIYTACRLQIISSWGEWPTGIVEGSG